MVLLLRAIRIMVGAALFEWVNVTGGGGCGDEEKEELGPKRSTLRFV